MKTAIKKINLKGVPTIYSITGMYEKGKIHIYPSHAEIMYSYNTPIVAKIGGVTYRLIETDSCLSNTTMRHVRAYLANDFKKKDVMALPKAVLA